MDTTRKIAAYALTALLVGGSAGGAIAQTTGTGTDGAATSTASTNHDNDRGWDWGWLGLIGLVGLAGLMRRDRAPYDAHNRAGMGTTTAAR